MWSNTKALVVASCLLIFFGLGFLWFGTKSSPDRIVRQISIPASSSATAGLTGERVLVTRVIDGDTIEINGRTSVRLVGIDTPETVDPRRPVGCFGKEASSKTKELLTGKTVILERDVSETDKYHRLLRYVYLPLDNGQTLFVNDFLVREGFARVLTYPPDVFFNERFRQAESTAREQKKGLWGKC